MGFSAGGHLASTAGTHFDAGKPDAPHPIDRASCRPDFLVLAYPVVSFTAPWFSSAICAIFSTFLAMSVEAVVCSFTLTAMSSTPLLARATASRACPRVWMPISASSGTSASTKNSSVWSLL